MKKTLCFVVLLLSLVSAVAEARIYIPIDQPSDRKFPIAIPSMRGGGMGREAANIIRNDLTLSGYFEIINPDSIDAVERREGMTADSINFSFWTAVEAQGLVKGEVQSEGDGFVATMRLFDPFAREMLIGKQYKAGKKELRRVAHRFSDEIMEALTGIRGVFNTKITYTAVTGKSKKEIFVMDMDGFGPYAVTKNKSINMSSNWSPDGGQLVFTSYMKGNPDLYVADAGGGNARRLTSGRGTNITPAWSPAGGIIALSSSVDGVPNLYTITPSGGKMKRLTVNGNIDISPSWSPGGDAIVFASERAGGLHLFRTSAGGGGASRLTFVGYQNDMPDWSPIGDKIVFAGRDMGTFDIFIMNNDGSNIQRLTIGTGSNEHPTFSPDGRFVTFSSTREGGASIFIMRADGSNQTRISKGNGMLPEWGPKTE